MAPAAELATLVQALRSSRKTAQAQAAGALARLAAMHPEERPEMVEAGVIRPLVQVLQSSSVAVQRPAAQLCSALARGSAALCAAIAAAGGIEALVAALRSSNGDVQQYSARWLASLAFASDQRSQAIVAAGASPLLVQLCGSSDPVVCSAAALALGNLSSTYGLEAAIAAAGAVQALADLLSASNGSGSSAAVAPRDAAIVAARSRLHAARALRNIADAHDQKVQAAIADSAAPAALVRLLRCSPNQEEAGAAAEAFGNIALAGYANTCAAIVAAGCIPALAELANSGGGSGHASTGGRSGGGDSSVAVGGTGSSSGGGGGGVGGAALGALLSLACQHPHSCGAILAAGCVPLFVQLLEQEDLEPSWQNTAAALANILSSTGAAGAAAVTAAGGAEVLLGVLSSQAGGPALQGAAGVLQQLAAAGQLSAAQAASAALALERLCGHSDERVSHAALEAKQSLLSCTAGPATAAAAAEGQSSAAAAQAASTQQQRQQRPPRVCAAPGCGATANLRRCGGCGAVRYCSEACSKAHWRAHKAECRRLQAEQAGAA